MSKEIKINKTNRSITFINNNIGFSQMGVAPEILDLIENQEQEIERLKKANKKLQRIANKNEVENFVLKSIIKEVREKIEDIKSNYFKRYDDEVYKLCDDILEILDKGE